MTNSADAPPEPLTRPPYDGSELDTQVGAIERQRRILLLKTEGLVASDRAQRLAPSTMHLAGLVKHLAMMEEHVFTEMFSGDELGPPWSEVDEESEPDWLWTSSLEDSPEELFALYRAAVDRSRAVVARARRTGGSEQHGAAQAPDGSYPPLRFWLSLLLEEYARHLGHVDLIRESIDGMVGERPEG